ncbi:MAG: RNA 2',3'-cyclic phosphodiesterase [Polaromonas sp.]
MKTADDPVAAAKTRVQEIPDSSSPALRRKTPFHDKAARLFLALWPSPRVQAALLDYQKAWHWNARVSLVRPENLHLTLHFMGNVPRDRLALLIQGLAVPLTPFTLTFGQPDLWPSGMAVLAPQASPANFRQLHDLLGQALQRLELPVENREFRPHITLARRASCALPPAHKLELHWPVQDYALVESVAEPTGQYRLLQRYA